MTRLLQPFSLHRAALQDLPPSLWPPNPTASYCFTFLLWESHRGHLRWPWLTITCPHPGPRCAIFSALPWVSWQEVLPFVLTHPKIQQLGIKPVAVVVVGCWVGRDGAGAAGWEHQTVPSAPGAKDCPLSHPFVWIKVWHQGNLSPIGCKATASICSFESSLKFEEIKQKPKHNPKFWR